MLFAQIKQGKLSADCEELSNPEARHICRVKGQASKPGDHSEEANLIRRDRADDVSVSLLHSWSPEDDDPPAFSSRATMRLKCLSNHWMDCP